MQSKIIAIYLKGLDYQHPISGEPLSKKKRMDQMYSIATNNVYDMNYTTDERVLAVEFIKRIIIEDQPNKSK